MLPITEASTPRFIHVVNPFTGGRSDGLDEIQKATLNAMALAKSCCKADVSLVLALEEGDEDLSFDFAESVSSIGRYVCDTASFKQQKRLPMLYDILKTALQHSSSDEDYLIYTNVDIIPVPHFYDALAEITARGIDAFSVNRRTLSDSWKSTCSPLLTLSEIGDPHPGTDCLVFKAKYLRSFIDSQTCLGAIHVTKSLLYNLAALSPRLVIIRDAYLTCHIGDDRGWKSGGFTEYAEHNKKEAVHVASELCAKDPIYRDKLLRFAAERKDSVLLDFFFPPSGLKKARRSLTQLFTQLSKRTPKIKK